MLPVVKVFLIGQHVRNFKNIFQHSSNFKIQSAHRTNHVLRVLKSLRSTEPFLTLIIVDVQLASYLSFVQQVQAITPCASIFPVSRPRRNLSIKLAPITTEPPMSFDQRLDITYFHASLERQTRLLDFEFGIKMLIKANLPR